MEGAIAGVYAGPLEDFVRRRDAAAKELRAAGERDAAAAVKSLRKPSRIAWALDRGAQDSPDAMESLEAAVAMTLTAQAAGGDVRAAMAALRGAVREFAGRAAEAAARSGHRVEPGALSNAVLAVLGTPESFAQLRGGRLAEVPEAGGLDFLASLPTPAESPTPRAESESAAASRRSSERAEPDEAARAAARQAVRALGEARERLESAQQALRAAQSRLHAADEGLRHAEEEARAAREACDRARREADDASSRLVEAEDSVARTGSEWHSHDATRAGDVPN